MADIHATALTAFKATEDLVTELAHEGASDTTIQSLKQCSSILHQVVEALGKGQEETGDEEPSSIDQAAAATHEDMQTAAAQRNA